MVRPNVSDQLTATFFKIKNFYAEGGGSGFLKNLVPHLSNGLKPHYIVQDRNVQIRQLKNLE
jgi:hypothetical protein